MSNAWLVLLASYLISSTLTSSTDDATFTRMVLEELQTLKTRVLKLESENKLLIQKLDTQQHKRQTGQADIGFPIDEVAFSAKVKRHLTNLNADQTIVFDNITTNSGGHYDDTSGMFTVPVSGTYLLFANILSEEHSYIETEIMNNGHLISDIYSAGNPYFGAGSNLVIVHLKKGDKVWVKVHGGYSSNKSVHCCWSTFSGYLMRVAGHDGPTVVVG